MNALQGIDHGALSHFQHHRDPVLAQLLGYFSFMGTYPIQLLLLVLCLLLLAVRGHRRAMAYLCLLYLTGVVLVEFLIYLVARERPQGWAGPESLDSFPCTPVALSALLYFGVAHCFAPCAPGRLWRWSFFVVAAGLTCVAAFGEVFFCTYHVSDVLGGLVVASVVLVLYQQLFPSVQPLPE